MQALAESFERQLPNKDSNLTALEDVLTGTKALVIALDGLASKETSRFLGYSQKAFRCAKLSKDILHFMVMYFKEEGLLKMPKYPGSQWSQT